MFRAPYQIDRALRFGGVGEITADMTSVAAAHRFEERARLDHERIWIRMIAGIRICEVPAAKFDRTGAAHHVKTDVLVIGFTRICQRAYRAVLEAHRDRSTRNSFLITARACECANVDDLTNDEPDEIDDVGGLFVEWSAREIGLPPPWHRISFARPMNGDRGYGRCRCGCARREHRRTIAIHVADCVDDLLFFDGLHQCGAIRFRKPDRLFDEHRDARCDGIEHDRAHRWRRADEHRLHVSPRDCMRVRNGLRLEPRRQ
jgi:hypothetical protein